MHPTILILEDDSDRTRAFQECLLECFPPKEVIVFDNAPDTIDWLQDHLEEALLICLDHDLGPNRVRDGDVFDPGTGRDVADYLATRKPCCPVVIHTTNSLAAPGMTMTLEDAGWSWARVVPYNDLEWVRADWVDYVLKALAKN
jgi:hypothetical protein